jgi:predicted ATP-grasp superfamily ATP-dependent carboligase
MSQRVGVVGASARAAVHSLARADRSAWAVDLFADRDLARVAECILCPSDRYPDAIPVLAKQFPSGPVMFAGGLENYPHLISELATHHELWGNRPDVLARVRDPFVLFPALAESGFATPQLAPRGEPCPSEGRWLRKPFSSGGGLGIRFARPGESASPHHYFQEFVAGSPMSAQYDGPTLLGVTEQLVGESWLHAAPFAYCGNIGPVRVAGRVESNLLSAADRFNRAVWLHGLVGIDYIDKGGVINPVEVNPRYTAAVEVLEHAWHEPYLAMHSQSFVRKAVPVKFQQPALPTVGKAIYYAPRDLHFPHSGPWDADLAGEFDPWRLPAFADIPEPGAGIACGHPVLTFFATGSTPAEVRDRLQSRAAKLDAILK